MEDKIAALEAEVQGLQRKTDQIIQKLIPLEGEMEGLRYKAGTAGISVLAIVISLIAIIMRFLR